MPSTASVTTPADGSMYRAATVPAGFSGSAADGTGGSGLNANSTTFTLQRNADNFYWTGTAWQAGVFNLATTHSATTGTTAAAWTSSATLPTWASESDGVYTVRAKATNTVGNSFTGSAVIFTLDKTAPITASVTAPAAGSALRAATVPASFTGSTADNNGGVGLNANSTTFILQRSSDNFYWTGSVWQAGVFTLATSHSATTGNTMAAWTSSATMPNWSSQTDGAYTVRATATDIAGNSFTGSPASFTLDETAPAISVTGPANGSAFRAATAPAAISGAAADNNGGVGLNANTTTFTLQRSSDNNYWTGLAWQSAAFNLATTHSGTTGNTAASWTSNATMPAWTSQAEGTYTVAAAATDKVGNASTSAISFTLDTTAPSVTAPASGSTYRSATMPASFTGGAGDNSGGVGLSANGTTFTLQRVSDGLYWTGSAWQAGTFDLATTHNATTGGNTAAWTSSITMPAWASESNGSYTVRMTATDMVGNGFTGGAITFTLDNTTPSPLAIGTVASDSSAETTLSIPANIGVAETIFVTIAMDPTTSNVSVTDNAGNIYTKDADVTDGSDTSGVRTLIFRAPISVALGGSTITVNFPAPTPAGKTASFFSFNGVGTLDRTHTAVGTDNGPTRARPQSRDNPASC